MSRLSLYEDDTRSWGLIEGDALMVLVKLPESSVDAIVCDPPYGIALGGESWDGRDIRTAAGGVGVSDGETFERWTRCWAMQALRVLKPGGHLLAFGSPRTAHRLACGIEDAGLEIRDKLLWVYGSGIPKSRRLPDGQGTALKPAYEPILLARKPLEGTTGENIAKWGTGALNIDATRIGKAGYWPSHLAFSHPADCPAELIDREAPGPSRLLYCAKVTKSERDAGCAQLPARKAQVYTGRSRQHRVARNIHPTVKPLTLMRWLVRLVTPAGGVVLDPFTGSGSTGSAALLERHKFLGIEREGDYVDIACARLTHWAAIAAQTEVQP